MRSLKRKSNEMRPISIVPNYIIHAQGSCLIEFGNTKVICTATIEEKVPKWLKGSKKGWVSAEYGMLPHATHDRTDREASKGKQSGRTQEIQRLIGRSLRCGVDLEALGERQIKIDCDVIQADGGTRCASINGGYVAMFLALQKLVDEKKLKSLPIIDYISAVSCGICEDQVLLDLDYKEDSSAHVDANFVINGKGEFIEIQSTGEKKSFSSDELANMLALAQEASKHIIRFQQKAIMNYAG